MNADTMTIICFDLSGARVNSCIRFRHHFAFLWPVAAWVFTAFHLLGNCLLGAGTVWWRPRTKHWGIAVLIFLACLQSRADQVIRIADVSPARVEGGENGQFVMVYDLSMYKAPGWLPAWSFQDAVGLSGHPISKEDVRKYLNSLPAEARLKVDMRSAKFRLACDRDQDWDSTSPNFGAFKANDQLPSVDALIWRGKVSDDGIMASLEDFDEAYRPGVTRRIMYERLTHLALSVSKTPGPLQDGARLVAAKLLTARTLSGELPAATWDGGDAVLAAMVKKQIETLQKEEFRYKPVSFYTWDDELRRIFIRDRVLAEAFTEEESPTACLIWLVLLRQDPKLALAFGEEKARRTELTGKPHRDFQEMFNAALGNQDPATVLCDGAKLADVVGRVQSRLERSEKIKFALLPAAATPETQFRNTLTLEQIPDYMKLFLKAIRDGQCSLDPGPEGPWYLFQQHSLEPLLTWKSLPDGIKLAGGWDYELRLAETFQALYAAHRETHAKIVEYGGPPSAARPFPRRTYALQIRLLVPPVNRVEPMPEVYRRTALAYDRLGRLLARHYGDAPTLTGRREMGGKADLTANAEADSMASLYRGLYLTACDDLGMTPVDAKGNPTELRAAAKQFLEGFGSDPDNQRDVRFMLPLAPVNVPPKTGEGPVVGKSYPLSRLGRGGIDFSRDPLDSLPSTRIPVDRADYERTTYYWAVYGVCEKRLYVSFDGVPKIELEGDLGSRVALDTTSSTRSMALARFMEIELPGSGSLNRAEFRALVDKTDGSANNVEKALVDWANASSPSIHP